MDTTPTMSFKDQMRMMLNTPKITAGQVKVEQSSTVIAQANGSVSSITPVPAVTIQKSVRELLGLAAKSANVEQKKDEVISIDLASPNSDTTVVAKIDNDKIVDIVEQKQPIAVPEAWHESRNNTFRQREITPKASNEIIALDPILNNVDVKALLQDRSIPLSERLALRRKLEEEAKNPQQTEQNKLVVSDPRVLAPSGIPIRLQVKHTLSGEPVEYDKETFKLPSQKHEAFSLNITLNARQQLAADYASQGKSFVLTGPAGSGKTTALREVARSCLLQNTTGTHHFGYYEVDAPSIAFCAYTNRATDNMRRAIEKDDYLAEELKYNVLTIHKLLEYTMEWRVSEKGNTYPHFFPKRNAQNKLDITHLGIEEGSQVDIPLWRELYAALRPGTVVMLIGDINQLPPVFGPSVFNYGLVQLPVIELNEIYRQALESPVLAAAHKVLKGEMPEPDGKYFKLYQSKPGAKSPSEQQCCAAFINTWKGWIKNGEYNPMIDICLSPYNKTDPGKDSKRDNIHYLSTKNLNYHMAQHLGQQRKAKIHEVLAGRNTWYLAEGDRVMIEKQDGVISKISMNGRYSGKVPKSVINEINRFGTFTAGHTDDTEDIDADGFELTGYENLNVDDIPEEDQATAASNVVEVTLDDGKIVVLDTAGEFTDAKFNLGYCLSVHKAQGSEWRKVIVIIHKNFAPLMFRELVYTAITRAREYCYVIDMTNYLQKAIGTQRIKGNTIDEKIEWFNSKLTMTEQVDIIPAKHD